ncbi:hypothetical protein CDAR_10041 [Caerostris darwini]|uniref:Uncharacterized protein n=1 Tax=Caerostris darwini TaxID=1538125 RepID=A0AAV4UB60_9ARAC|nr:hypothetical protein CDAR_10041 [Caerostris darwini]
MRSLLNQILTPASRYFLGWPFGRFLPSSVNLGFNQFGCRKNVFRKKNYAGGPISSSEATQVKVEPSENLTPGVSVLSL